jgi:hypothetical protein
MDPDVAHVMRIICNAEATRQCGSVMVLQRAQWYRETAPDGTRRTLPYPRSVTPLEHSVAAGLEARGHRVYYEVVCNRMHMCYESRAAWRKRRANAASSVAHTPRRQKTVT